MGKIINITDKLILMKKAEDKETDTRRKRAIHSCFLRYSTELIREKDILTLSVNQWKD